LKTIYIAAVLVALFLTGVIAIYLRSPPNPSSTNAYVASSRGASPTPSANPSPSADKSTKPGATPSPTGENIVDLTYLTGAYYLYPLDNPSGDSLGTMTLRVRKGNLIVAQGAGWKGSGRIIDGKQGHYDWQFEDGKHGRTTILVNDDGTLQGHVFGSGLDWWYLARRQR
jgi:hypothetical protein